MTVVRLDHFNIRAPKQVIEEVIEFYGEILGLITGPRPNFSSEGAWLYFEGHPYIHLTVDEEATVPGRNEHLNHIAFHCNGLDKYLKSLKAADIEFADAYIPDLDMTQLFFYDPSGIQIELNFVHEKISTD